MTQKKGTVEKERVVCQNCRYHYSFLYDAKEPASDSHPTMSGNLTNYLNRRESFRACPHCGYYQDWMVQVQRRHRLVDLILLSLVGACGLLLYLVYQMIVVALSPVQTGGFEGVYQAQWILLGYVGLVAAAAGLYAVYLRWIWNPNREVDTQSYEAAVPQEIRAEDFVSAASQYEAATRTVAEVELPRRRLANPWETLSMPKKVLIGLGAFGGACSLVAPVLSPELALNLAQRGMTMLPFYVGVAFLLSATLCGSWQFIDQRLR